MSEQSPSKLAGAAKAGVIGGGSLGGLAAVALIVAQHFGYIQPPSPAAVDDAMQQRFDDHLAEDAAWKREAEAARRALWKALRGTAAEDEGG